MYSVSGQKAFSGENYARLAKCHVDVAFPPGYKQGSPSHCPWYRDHGALPQIVEVTDTGWETYHFASLEAAQAFADETLRHIADGTFAGGRFPAGAPIGVQLRATTEVSRDWELHTA